MDRGSKCGSNQVLRSHLNSERRHLPPLVQWYKVQCHPWKWINCRTCTMLSVDPGDGDSSTIQNSKSRTSIYRRGTLSTHIVPPRCTLSRDHPVLHHCTTIPVMIWGLILIWFHWQMLSRRPFTRPVSVHLPHSAVDLIMEICKL